MRHSALSAECGLQPLVTIGVPCYNCAPYLPLLLRSILAQTYPHWEVIAVDDGSTDGTREILADIRDPRFRVVLGDENLGLASRLNQIASLARGLLLARTDADDILMPERLERQVELFVADPSLDVACSGCYVVDNQNRVRGVRRIPPLAETVRDVMLRNGPSHPTVMTTTAWARHNEYLCQSRRGEDLDLWIRTVEGSRMRALDGPLHIIREDPGFDANKYLRTIQDHRAILRRHLNWKQDPLLAIRVETRLLARQCGYRWGDWLGLAGWMASRRQAPMDNLEIRGVEDYLASLRDTASLPVALAS